MSNIYINMIAFMTDLAVLKCLLQIAWVKALVLISIDCDSRDLHEWHASLP